MIEGKIGFKLNTSLGVDPQLFGAVGEAIFAAKALQEEKEVT